MAIRIHKEGYKIIGVLLLFLLAINTGVYHLSGYTLFFYFNLVLSATALFLVVFFFRNPLVEALTHENEVLAPADGKIVAIEQVREVEYFNDDRLLISIFMSPLNVHVNRIPVNGIVKYIKYHPGKYFVAWHPKSSTQNERNSIVIVNGKTEILIRQIAGAVARRIVNYLKQGDVAEQGRDLGFIKFGSRVDLYLPVDTNVLVQLSQKVKGGHTILARL